MLRILSSQIENENENGWSYIPKKQDAEDTRISRVAGKNENGWS